MSAREWNPRYLAYAAAHGHAGDPEAMLAADRVAWPGGVMAGFLTWSSEQLRAWCALKGYRRTASGHSDHVWSDADHAEYDAWLHRDDA